MRQVIEVMRDRLSVYLGPNTARAALKSFGERAIGNGFKLEDMSAAEARAILDALRPLLKTLVGAEQCERIVAQLKLELELHE